MTSPCTAQLPHVFNDDGVTSLYVGIIKSINEKTGAGWTTRLKARPDEKPSSRTIIIPPERSGYLSEIAACVRRYHEWGREQERLARKLWQLDAATMALREDGLDEHSAPIQHIRHLQESIEKQLDPRALRLVGEWDDIKHAYSGDDYVFTVRGREIRTPLKTKTLSGSLIPKIVLPQFHDRGEILRWRLRENLPGMFPYTAGVFPFKRQDEDPTRMFAGEGDPFRTNRRFKIFPPTALQKGYQRPSIP